MKKILTFISFACVFIVTSQTKLRQEIKGDRYFFSFAFSDAIDSYTSAKTLTAEGQSNLAEAYRNTGDFLKSEEAYVKLFSNSKINEPSSYFNFAQVLKSNGKFDEAEKWLEKFSTLYPTDLRAISFKENKANLLLYKSYREDVIVSNLEMNTEAQDFGTNYFKDKIVYVSSNSKPTVIKRTYNWNDQPFLNLFIAQTNHFELIKSKRFLKKFHSKLHDGPASFSSNGEHMAFTTNTTGKKHNVNSVYLQILMSDFSKNKWSTPYPFKQPISGSSVGHPALSLDGKTMYFASDQPGGCGGVDLYISTLEDGGKWSAPENLGSEINTEGNEMFPFFEEKNQILYFASDGHFGIGGLDIFQSHRDGATWGKVLNLGSPLNTQFDDFGWIINANEQTGYFSSNRLGGKGSDDIYGFEFLKDYKKDTLSTDLTPPRKNSVEENSVVIEEVSKPAKDTNVYQLQSIYFDFDSYAIRPDAAKELDKIIVILNNHPDMKLELSSFTDSRGTEEYNDLLSEYRAKETCNYIQLRIYNPKRVTGKGYGKRKLLYETNEDLNEKDMLVLHGKNRRTEFKFKY